MHIFYTYIHMKLCLVFFMGWIFRFMFLGNPSLEIPQTCWSQEQGRQEKTCFNKNPRAWILWWAKYCQGRRQLFQEPWNANVSRFKAWRGMNSMNSNGIWSKICPVSQSCLRFFETQILFFHHSFKFQLSRLQYCSLATDFIRIPLCKSAQYFNTFGYCCCIVVAPNRQAWGGGSWRLSFRTSASCSCW